MALTQTQYDTLMAEYERIRLENRRLRDERVAKIEEQIPEISQIELDIRLNAIQASRAKLKHEPVSFELTRQKNQSLIERKKQLLIQHGYPADFLEPSYTCNTCKDTGYVGTKPCTCYSQRKISLLYQQSHLQRILSTENFDTLTYQYYDTDTNPVYGISEKTNMEQNVARGKQFVKDFDSTFDNLLLHGETGLGKSFYANCIAKELLDNGHTLLYLSAPELFQNVFSKTVIEKQTTYQEEYHYVFDCDLLIIDDLGTEYTNSMVSTHLYQCLNERMLKEKSTIISTNLSLSEIRDRYSERVYSRIAQSYTFINFFGSDIRLKMRKALINKNMSS